MAETAEEDYVGVISETDSQGKHSAHKKRNYCMYNCETEIVQLGLSTSCGSHGRPAFEESHGLLNFNINITHKL